ncbi:unnamed protein product [Schistocephalus solidus]|uniref:Uncharacterized protein n=1 Tax=Schistocephalus solidus TaxID=70667 RepID=A0A3P7D071_SCHSO|nr:unnamed protein product [Schistocephalus solidus]
MLKGFQTEVDDLTARSQKIEDTIVKIYRRVAVLPEAQSISDRVKKSTELQLENMKLRDMLKETQTELESCRSSALQSAQSQLFDFQTRFDELQMAKYVFFAPRILIPSIFRRSKEVELLLGDLEKANERIALLETPKNKVAIVGEGESTERSHGTVDFELASTIEDLTSKLEQKKSEVDSLSQALHAAEERHQQTVGELQARLTASATALEAAETKVTTLTNELDRRHDYDDLCREITVLRSIEFPEGSEKLGMEEGQGAAEVSLEVRLRRKNEQLKNTIASISAEREQLEGVEESAIIHAKQFLDGNLGLACQEEGTGWDLEQLIGFLPFGPAGPKKVPLCLSVSLVRVWVFLTCDGRHGGESDCDTLTTALRAARPIWVLSPWWGCDDSFELHLLSERSRFAGC